MNIKFASMINSILKLILMFMFIQAASANPNLSVTFSPSFDRQNVEPQLIIAYQNTGDEVIRNLSSYITSDLAISESGQYTNTVFFTNIKPGETKYKTIQYQYPQKNQDISFTTFISYEKADFNESFEIVFIVPALIVANIPTITFSSIAVYPLVGLLLLCGFIYFKKRKKIAFGVYIPIAITATFLSAMSAVVATRLA